MNEDSIMKVPEINMGHTSADITMDAEVVKAKPEVVASFIMTDKKPSNWSIVIQEKGIRAVNSHDGQVFEGTIAEFNKALRS